MKVALVHDWLTGMRGGERVLEALCEIYPEADIYTLLHIKGSVSQKIEKHRILTSFLQNVPGIKKIYRYLLPLMPKAIESFKLDGYDLILSSSHCVAKGVLTSSNAVHICYCHTPMRYLWHMRQEYFSKSGKNYLQSLAMSFCGPYLKNWDIQSSNRVNHFIANSQNTKNRIKEYYSRDSAVIYPPVDTKKFVLDDSRVDFYLVVSAFAPYKRVDIAIEAFNLLGLPLKIIGSGQEEKNLKKIAKNNIEFLGWQPDIIVAKYYAQCSALIFPGEEDFGIVPLEAMACGKPVIAFAKGGVLESVVPLGEDDNFDSATGLFFYQQTSEALCEAVGQFEKIKKCFKPNKIREHVFSFDKNIFKKTIEEFIRLRVENHGHNPSG